MDVRQATAEDVREIQKVAQNAWHAAHDEIIGKSAVEDFLTRHYSREDILTGISDADAPYFVAEDDTGGIVGFITGGPWRDSETTFVVGAIYVLRTHWRRGVGGQLLERFEEEVKSRGGDQVRLVVMAKNDAAIDFYESVGYEQIDNRYDDDLDVRGRVYRREFE